MTSRKNEMAAMFPNVKIMVFSFFVFEVCMYASSKTL